MKRIIITILAFFYLSTATGITLHVHYCMGKLADWNLWSANEKACSKCGMEKDQQGDDCCKETQHLLKLKADQKTAPLFISFFSMHPVADASMHATEWLEPVQSTAVRLPFSHAPPESGPTAIYLRHCVFRI